VGEVKKEDELYSGKTKIVWNVVGQPKMVVLENKKDITAFDDPKKTRLMETKPQSATTTTCRVFELLKQAGIPVAYIKQLSATEFLAPKYEMIQLEVIVRRYAVGSYLKRHPELEKGKDEIPHRFNQLVVEFFLKTSSGQLKIGEEVLVQGLGKKEEDPFIINPYEQEWRLFHSKKTADHPEADLKRTVQLSKVVKNVGLMKKMAVVAPQVFRVLEGAWAMLGCRLIDFKIEFGITDGWLYVADVIDNDSWRLRDTDWNELSKQLFRDGEDLAKVEDKYQLVAALSQRFHVPKQALVLWRGSTSDPWPEIDANELSIKGVDVIKITGSGHKATINSLEKLSELMARYPEGGVIATLVGMSNGLGPVLSAHTTWPVAAVPMTLKSFPMDVWSSVRMPSNVPMATIASDKNAILYALNILAQKNPIIWAMRQEKIESLEAEPKEE